MNWRRPVCILSSAVCLTLFISSVSTTHWMQKEDDNNNILHLGLFRKCLNNLCEEFDDKKVFSWTSKVKTLAVLSIIFAAISFILTTLRLCFEKHIKQFIAPALMLLSTILIFSTVSVYSKTKTYINESNGKEITDKLNYGWSFITAWLAGLLLLMTSLFNLYTDFVDVFGSSERHFRAQRLDEEV